MFANQTSGEKLMPKTYKELSQGRKKNTQILKCMKDSKRPCSEEDKQMTNKYMRNMLNTTNRKGNSKENFIPIKMAII